MTSKHEKQIFATTTKTITNFFCMIKNDVRIKPNFFKESTVYQNQTNSIANYSNLKENPAQKHKFGPGLN